MCVCVCVRVCVGVWPSRDPAGEGLPEVPREQEGQWAELLSILSNATLVLRHFLSGQDVTSCVCERRPVQTGCCAALTGVTLMLPEV